MSHDIAEHDTLDPAGTVVPNGAPATPLGTTVYYGSQEQAATAKAMAKALGQAVTKLSSSVASSGVVVVVGSDFSG